jgi:predicted nucleotidyltransferase
VLAEIVRRLVDAVDPDAIILFGSRAAGHARPDSDFDLMIIKEPAEQSHRRSIPAYRAMRGIGVPMDILWYTPEEADKWRETINHIICTALEKSRIVYDSVPGFSRSPRKLLAQSG